MEIVLTELLDSVSRFSLPMVRIYGMLLSGPVFGSQLMPQRVRILLAIIFSFPIVFYQPMNNIDLMSFLGMYMVILQFIIGVAIGFVMQLIFQIFIFSSGILAMQSGLGFASMVDPQAGFTVPLVSQLYLMLVTLLFLAFNGHLQLIQVIYDSFKLFPITNQSIAPDFFFQIVHFGKVTFDLGLALALPATIVLLIITIAFGIMTRTAPQINIFSIGFPVNIMMAFVLIYFTINSVCPLAENAFSQGFECISKLFR